MDTQIFGNNFFLNQNYQMKIHSKWFSKCAFGEKKLPYGYNNNKIQFKTILCS